ncbi:conserved hypothetical protein [Histoplasma capsulatum H143]|uniref:ditrans,polycis-polyprenyl diphosphate synthase [(2E,6E)-farnesyldiphosphate specific] n=1 Tax=Ajellomyces capsulatus (strain H143) TaxID=544712 RepID=C6HAZ5_AJECH|nr:conserved hypothetical protein [Histoplasma capsulatum H143]
MALPTDPRIRRNSRVDTSKLTPAEREALLKPYLPDPSTIRSARSRHGKKKQKQRRKPIRAFLKSTLHYLTYFLIHVVFSIYIRLRQGYHAIIDRILAILYYHHRTPELIQKDVRGLSQLPQHLSIVLMLGKDEDALIKLSTYYGPPSHQPTLRLFAPHHALYSPTLCPPSSKANPALFTLLLLSATDGRETLVDLTKTLTEMAQHGNLSPQDISPKLIDAEISELTSPPTPPLGSTPGDPLFDERNSIASSAGTGSSTAVSDSPRSLPADAATAVLMKSDPDLLMVFGPFVRLDGYPPWQLRLTEIYCTGDQGSLITGGGEAVEYQKFLKGLWRYARAEMRFGR